MHRKTAKINFYNNTKDTFEKHLIESLKPQFYMELQDIYSDVCKNTKSKKNIPVEFQNIMKELKNTKSEKLLKSCQSVYSKLPCKNYVRKLVEAVLLTNNKILTLSATITGVNTEIVVPDVPTMEVFFTKCFCEIGKTFHRNPYLLCNENEAPSKRLSALSEALVLIELSIKNTINGLVPYGTVLDVYLNTIKNDNETYEEEEPKREEYDESDNESVMSDGQESVTSDMESEISNNEEEEEDDDNESVMSEKSDNDDVSDVESEKSLEHEDNNQQVSRPSSASSHARPSTANNQMPTEEEPNQIEENNFDKDEVLSTGEDIPDEFNIVTYKDEGDQQVVEMEKELEKEDKPEKEETKVIKITPAEQNSSSFSFGFAKGASNDI